MLNTVLLFFVLPFLFASFAFSLPFLFALFIYYIYIFFVFLLVDNVKNSLRFINMT